MDNTALPSYHDVYHRNTRTQLHALTTGATHRDATRAAAQPAQQGHALGPARGQAGGLLGSDKYL
jgi:transposase